MSFLRTHGWRLSLVAAGVLVAVGGPMHPSSDAPDSMTQELATMTADAAWVPGHTLIMVGTLLLVAGLWLARARDVWPTAYRALTVAAVTMSLYAVETAFHLAAVADSAALAAGEMPPLTLAHLALATVLYPLSGTGLVLLGIHLVATESGIRRVVPVLAVVGGVLHGSSIIVTLLVPDFEATPLFAAAGMSIALWSLLTGLLGASSRQAARSSTPETVAA
jgi:hypothetical protein